MNISDHFITEPSEDDLALEQHQIELERDEQMNQLQTMPQNAPQSNLNPIQQYWLSDGVLSELQKNVGERHKAMANNIVQIINDNPQLKNADASSIMGAALTADALGFPINKTLGFAYIVPFETSTKQLDQYGRPVKDNFGKDVWNRFQSAQLQIGYKGFIQLAQRTGKFKIIDACVVYQGDTNADVINRMNSLIPQDNTNREVIGYTAYFELHDGFTGHYTMTVAQVKEHATKFSQSYRIAESKRSNKPPKSVWHDNFEAMALKTVIKMLLSKKAPLSIEEFAIASKADQSVIINGQYRYVDNEVSLCDQLAIELKDAQTLQELNAIGQKIANQPITDKDKNFLRNIYSKVKQDINNLTQQAFADASVIEADYKVIDIQPSTADCFSAEYIESDIIAQIGTMTLEDMHDILFYIDQSKPALGDVKYKVLKAAYNQKCLQLERTMAA